MSPPDSSPPPGGTPSKPPSWRPLFVPRTLDQKVRRGRTTSSELPPPLEDPVALPPLAAPRAVRVHRTPALAFALLAVLFAGALIVLLRL